MRLVTSLLSFRFTGLEVLTSVLVLPLTLICGLGLIGFTVKIARDLKNQNLAAYPSLSPGEPRAFGAAPPGRFA